MAPPWPDRAQFSVPDPDEVLANLRELRAAPPARQAGSGSGGVKPPGAVRDWDAFESMTSDAIKAKASRIDPGGVDAIRAVWQQAANDLDDAFVEFGSAFVTAVTEKWRSGAGFEAASAVSRYIQRTYQMVEAAYSTAGQLDRLYHAMAATRSAVRALGLPPPAPADGFDAAGLPAHMWPGRDWQAATNARHVADAAAIHIMTTVYRPGIHAADVNTPAIDPIAAPVAAPAPQAGGPPREQDKEHTAAHYLRNERRARQWRDPDAPSSDSEGTTPAHG